MNCPKCGTVTENGFCNKCNKSVKDIYFKLYNEAQGKRDYETALFYIEDLKKYAESEEEIKEYEEIVNKIEFVKMNESEMGKKAVKIKNIKKIGRLTQKERLKRAVVFLIFLISATFIGVTGYNKYNDFVKNRNSFIKGKKIKTSILVNIGGPLLTDDNKYYENLIDVMRKHKEIKFNLIISGILLQNINGYNSEIIKKIKDGVEDGQFEIIGSTYSQNVMECSDFYSNLWQLERDKELKREIFGVEPKGFYNPQGIWGKESVNLIEQLKYRYTFIDDSKLERVKSGYSSGKRGLFEKENITVLPLIKKCETNLKTLLNSEVEEISIEKEIKFITELREIYEKNSETESFASIFINFDNESIIDKKIKTFDKIIFSLKNEDWIENYKGSELAEITDSKYNVVNLLGNSEAEIGEIDIEGYKNWYDLARDSKKVEYYKEIQNKYLKFINENIKSDNKTIKNAAEIAKKIFLNSQYRFGDEKFLIGEREFNEGKREKIYESIKNIECMKDIMEGLSNTNDRIYEKDVTGDEKNEIIVINNRNYYVITPEKRGEIIGWYDLNTGEEIIPVYNILKNSSILTTMPEEEEQAEIFLFGNKLIKLKTINSEKTIRFTKKGIKMMYSTSEDRGSNINIRNLIVSNYSDIEKNENELINKESEKNKRVRVINKKSGTGIEFYIGKEGIINSQILFEGIEVMIQIPANKGTVEITKLSAGKENEE